MLTRVITIFCFLNVGYARRLQESEPTTEALTELLFAFRPAIGTRALVRSIRSGIRAMAINSDEWKKKVPGWESGSFQKPSESDITAHLTEMSKKYAMDPIGTIIGVTQRDATERPRTGKYDNNYQPGIYVDAVSGEPLYSSDAKYNCGCGWPGFTNGIDAEAITEKVDVSFGMRRVEIRSKHGDSHLGHVFEDGPPDRGGMRHCVNSAATIFIPYDKMDEEGYGAYKEKVKNLNGE